MLKSRIPNFMCLCNKRMLESLESQLPLGMFQKQTTATIKALVIMGPWVLWHPYFFETWVQAPKLFETWVPSILLFLRLWYYQLGFLLTCQLHKMIGNFKSRREGVKTLRAL